MHYLLLLAIQFLTRLPVPSPKRIPTAEDQGRSMLYYPLVGGVIGLLLLLTLQLASTADPLLQAVLVLFVWVLVTGGLHIDGLADVADAWVGGQGDRERTLHLMKDPTCGPIAVAAVVLVLLLKMAALQSLLAHQLWSLVLLAPVLGRASLIATFIYLPYVRPQGLGAEMAAKLPRRPGRIVLIATACIAVLIWQALGFWIMTSVFLCFLLLRHLLLGRLGGSTGDTAGAVCELTETVVLVSAALQL